MNQGIRIGALASSGGSNVQAIIDSCEGGRIDGEVVLVMSDKPDAGVLERARKHEIDAVHISVPKTGTPEWLSANDEIVDALRGRAVDLVVMAGYMRKVSPALLHAFPHAVMNIHPALLPSFPGTHGQGDANDHGVKLAGVTVHFADEEFDRGPIIIQGAVPVLDADAPDTLGARILQIEHQVYAQAVQWFAQGRLSIHGRRVLLAGSPAKSDASIIWPPIDMGKPK